MLTIALSIKVHDGIVLAADSASTWIDREPGGRPFVVKIYDNGIKVFNLHRGLPVGAITWGIGGIGPFSMAVLAKDFRAMAADNSTEWYINQDTYTIEDVALRFHSFMYEKNYMNAYREWPEKPACGFIVAGYSARAGLAEEWLMVLDNSENRGPILLRAQEQTGITWNGLPEALSRLCDGYGTNLPVILRESGVLSQSQVSQVMSILHMGGLRVPFVFPAMPIQDAIGLAEFLVDTTIKYSKYAPGAPVVGGPIEIATITKHEGFKWVRRKHYYDVRLNPKEGLVGGRN